MQQLRYWDSACTEARQEKCRTKKVKARELTQEPVEYRASAGKTTQQTVETSTKKIVKEPGEPYEDILPFPDTGVLSLFRNKSYEVSVSSGLESAQMNQIVFVFDSGTGANLIRSNILDPSLLNSIRHTVCWTPAVHSIPR